MSTWKTVVKTERERERERELLVGWRFGHGRQGEVLTASRITLHIDGCAVDLAHARSPPCSGGFAIGERYAVSRVPF